MTILASIKTGQFHTLDEIGNLVWDAMGDGQTVGDLISQLASQLGVPRKRVRDNLLPFLQDLHSRTLVDIGRAELPSRPIPEPVQLDEQPINDVALSGVLSMALLCVVSVALRLFSLEKVWRVAHKRIHRLRRVLPSNSSPSVIRQVALAATWSPLRAMCLEQSLVILWALRRRGVDARLQLGVQQYPFCAHAWVEYEGRPLNDQPENLKLYRTFPAPTSLTC